MKKRNARISHEGYSWYSIMSSSLTVKRIVVQMTTLSLANHLCDQCQRIYNHPCIGPIALYSYAANPLEFVLARPCYTYMYIRTYI